MSNITKQELDALAEIGRWYSGSGLSRIRPYYWRKASMQKLAARGLVEPYPGHGTDAQPAWRITAAGREALA